MLPTRTPLMPNGGPAVPDDQIAALFAAKLDTRAIGRLFGVPESQIANRLARIRDRQHQSATT